MSSDQVRQPLRARGRSRRTLDQRLSLLFPRLSRVLFRSVFRLPPSSRLRQRTLARAVELSLEGYNRRDPEVVFIGWAPDCEYLPDPRWVEAGLIEPCYRGFEGYLRYLAATDEVWDGQNVLTPMELIDLGDRFVVLAEGNMRARASGVPLTEAYGVVVTVSDGRIIRIDEYFDHAQTLEVAGVT
jgi:ketosteroid isomerase-like protein